MNFKMPKDARTRPAKSGRGMVTVLKDENVRYHEAAYGLERPVVMAEVAFTEGGHEPGEHDGLRDGYAPPRRSFKRVYCSLKDWLAAGNAHP